jgi:hypothetical protein
VHALARWFVTFLCRRALPLPWVLAGAGKHYLLTVAYIASANSNAQEAAATYFARKAVPHFKHGRPAEVLRLRCRLLTNLLLPPPLLPRSAAVLSSTQQAYLKPPPQGQMRLRALQQSLPSPPLVLLCQSRGPSCLHAAQSVSPCLVLVAPAPALSAIPGGHRLQVQHTVVRFDLNGSQWISCTRPHERLAGQAALRPGVQAQQCHTATL